MATTAAPIARRAATSAIDHRGLPRPAAQRPGPCRGARPTDDEVSLTWGELRERVDALVRRARPSWACGRGATRVALMLGQPAGFHLADLAVMTRARRRSRSTRRSRPSRSPTSSGTPGARVVDHRAALLAEPAGRAPRAARRRARDRRSTARRPARSRSSEVEGSNPDFDVEAAWRAVDARGRADADLHVRHHRAAEGRPARAPQPACTARRACEQLIHVPRRRRASSPWLPSAHIAERARAPLPADRLRPQRSRRCPNPTRAAGATCPRSGRTGSSRCRGSGRS